MAATPKPKRKYNKNLASSERKLNKEVLIPHGGKRKASERQSVATAKKVGSKSLVKFAKSMY